MKKITFLAIAAFFTASTMFAQTYSTGDIALMSDYTASIEVGPAGPAAVTLTLSAPRDLWFAFGFRDNDYTPGSGMNAGGDVVVYGGDPTPGFTDREFIGIGGEPSIDAVDDWTVVSDVIDVSTRTVIATRALTGTEANDFDFSGIGDGSTIDIVFARTLFGGFVLGYHGGGGTDPGRDIITGVTFSTLSTPDFRDDLNFSLSPNPAKEKFVVSLPTHIDNAQLEVYNVLGKRVLSQQISDINSTVNVANWNSGIYIVRVSNGDVSQTKRFVKQ